MLKFRDRKKRCSETFNGTFSSRELKKKWKNFYHANIEIGYP